MGIMAQCPNGHRVKVKDHLAGRKGLCPVCGAKFRVPKPVSVPGRSATTAAEEPDLPVARIIPLDPAVVATLPRALPPGASRALVREAEQPEPEEPEAETFESESLDADPVAARPLHPAIADRPDLSWCIAFPGGDPSEPVAGPSVQEWLDAGQATGTELVWRADWPQWLPIRDVFPDIPFGGAG